MDFIERIFGVSPDGGNGLFELLLFAIPIAGLAVIYLARSIRNGRKRSRLHDSTPLE
jgi:hypothetical protein